MISVAVSPDGAWIASGATDYGVHLSDPATGLTQVRIRGHSNTGAFSTVCFTSSRFADLPQLPMSILVLSPTIRMDFSLVEVAIAQ